MRVITATEATGKISKINYPGEKLPAVRYLIHFTSPLQLHAIGVLCGLMPSSNKLNHDTVLIKQISSGVTPVASQGGCGRFAACILLVLATPVISSLTISNVIEQVSHDYHMTCSVISSAWCGRSRKETHKHPQR